MRYVLQKGRPARSLWHGSVRLTGDDLPKFVVASNEQLEPEDKAIIAAQVSKNYKQHVNYHVAKDYVACK